MNFLNKETHRKAQRKAAPLSFFVGTQLLIILSLEFSGPSPVAGAQELHKALNPLLLPRVVCKMNMSLSKNLNSPWPT